MGGVEGSVLLGQAARRCGAEGVGRVVMFGQLSVGASPACSLLPAGALGRVGVGDRAEGFPRPLGRVLGDPLAQLGAAVVGRQGEVEQALLDVRRQMTRDQVGVTVQLRGQPIAVGLAEPEVQHLCYRRRPVQGGAGDSVGHCLGWVVPGQLDGAQQLVQCRAGLVSGQRDPMVVGQVPRRGQLVEPALGASGGHVGDHGAQRVEARGCGAGGLGGGLGLGQRRAVRVELGWADRPLDAPGWPTPSPAAMRWSSSAPTRRVQRPARPARSCPHRPGGRA